MEIAETMNGIEHGNEKVPIIGNCSTFHSLGFLLGTEAFPMLPPILGFQNFFLCVRSHTNHISFAPIVMTIYLLETVLCALLVTLQTNPSPSQFYQLKNKFHHYLKYSDYHKLN